MVVLRIVTEPPKRNLRSDRFGLCRDDARDLARLQPREDLRIGVAGVRRDGANGNAGGRDNRVEPLEDRLSLIDLSGRDLDIENDAAFVIDHAMLLVARFEPTVAATRRHGGLGISEADLLELAGLFRVAKLALHRGVACLDTGRIDFEGFVAIRRGDGAHMPNSQALPGYIGADQRGVDMDDLAFRDAGRDAGPRGPLEDVAKSLGAPALADARQGRVVRQPIAQAKAGEPADREVHLGLTHQPAVVHDAEQEPGEHQAHRRLWIYRRSPDSRGIHLGDLLMQPAEVEHRVDAGEDVVVRDQIAQRTADEEFQLTSRAPLQHSPPLHPIAVGNQDFGCFSTAPPCTSIAISSATPRSTCTTN